MARTTDDLFDQLIKLLPTPEASNHELWLTLQDDVKWEAECFPKVLLDDPELPSFRLLPRWRLRARSCAWSATCPTTFPRRCCSTC